MLSFMFAGQGAQHKGMGAHLFDDFRTLCARADEALGYSIRDLCLNDPDRRLAQTQYTQPALFVVGALSWVARMEQRDEAPAYVLGHSLGEYVALFAAESIDFATGVRLVAKRGELMARAAGGGMCAVVGKGLAELPDLLAQHVPDVDVANFNSDEQVVLSGPLGSLPAAETVCKKRGWNAIRLNVSGAFHSRYMGDAAAQFERFVAAFEFGLPRIPVVANVTGKSYPADAQKIRSLLVEQITRPVRWTDSIRFLRRAGVRQFEEIGAGKALAGMLAKIDAST